MKRLSWFLFLTILWFSLWGAFSPVIMFFGVALSLVLTLSMSTKIPDLPCRPWITLKFIVLMAKDLIISNLNVAKDVLGIRSKRYPGIIAFHLKTVTNAQDIWLANMISLTPGTLVLDFHPQKRLLFIHVMFLGDREAIVRELNVLENRIMELLPA
jgi:multicomponent Na+:H+ antiporter subunit E